MAQSPGVPVGRAPRAPGANWEPKPKGSPKAVLCLVPRATRINPIASLLRGYELAVADTTAQVLAQARRQPHDLYVVVTPLGWLTCVQACRRIRRFDPHTPLIVYVTDISSNAERREVLAAGAQAYIARGDPAQNFAGTAAQLIMLAELRSMDALNSAGPAIRDALVRRLNRMSPPGFDGAAGTARRSATGQLKEEARRLFAAAGGSRANFERLWPALYAEASTEAGRPAN